MQEIERKFLVSSEAFKEAAETRSRIVQGYLNSNPERTVRVRIRDREGFITIKGKSNESGTSRFEWEKEIPVAEAEELMKLCEFGSIEKYRYEIRFKNQLFEVDEFLGENLGLLLAELELESEDEVLEKPEWLGTEVTGKPEYYNSFLSKKPFKKWKVR